MKWLCQKADKLMVPVGFPWLVVLSLWFHHDYWAEPWPYHPESVVYWIQVCLAAMWLIWVFGTFVLSEKAKLYALQERSRGLVAQRQILLVQLRANNERQ
jgi:hypothetical protein